MFTFSTISEIFERYFDSSIFHKQLVFASIVAILLFLTKAAEHLNVYLIEKKHIDYGVEKSEHSILHKMFHISGMRIETVFTSLLLLLFLPFIPSILYSATWLNPLMGQVGIAVYAAVLAAVLIYYLVKMCVWSKEMRNYRALIAKGYTYQYKGHVFATMEEYDQFRLWEYFEDHRDDEFYYPRGGKIC